MSAPEGAAALDLQESPLSTRLDDDHFPETNGRMAVCRRCGFKTTGGPDERHASLGIQQARATRWLDNQAHVRRIADARRNLNT
jgi:hypothetical protein